jgi:hypothetical protein
MVSVVFIASLASFAWPGAPKQYRVKKSSPLSPGQKEEKKTKIPPDSKPTIKCAQLSITSPATLPKGTQGKPYSYQLQTSGGLAPISLRIVAGSLPPGLSLNPVGIILGTPSKFGAYSFTLKATDSCPSGAQTAQKSFSLSMKLRAGKEFREKGPTKELLKERLPAKIGPRIESAFRVPLGALQAGTKLYLKGKHFGTQPGKILMYGNFPNSPVALVYVNWESDTDVNGIVPQSTNGQANQTVEIKVRRSDDMLSNPWQMGFQGREEKILTRNDVAVLQCGEDGNRNICNSINTGDGMFMNVECSSDSAICGGHHNTCAAVGRDDGKDIYQISLKNGWTFKSMQITKWEKTSEDEVLSGPNPTVPVGQSDWTLVMTWDVTQCDSVRYGIKIMVEGPIGTSYK